MHASKLFDLSGEVALVTGASSGLGERFAEVLAAHGASVVVAARRADRLASLVERITNAGGNARAVELDVSDQGAIAGAFDAAETAFGTVTILVNNAGVAGNKAVFDMTPEDWRTVMAVNLDGVFYTYQAAVRHMGRVQLGTLLTDEEVARLSAFLRTLTGRYEPPRGAP